MLIFQLDEFLEPLLSVIASFVDPPPGQEPTEYSLLQVLQNPEKSNCIVVVSWPQGYMH